MAVIDVLQHVLDEYGCGPIRAAHESGRGWDPRPIPSANAYVGAVRRAQGWASPTIDECGGPRTFPPEAGGGADGRRLAPLWRECPVAPGNRTRIGEWLAYWAATQPRPDPVGSSYNDKPDHAVRAWRCGIPPHAYPRGLVALLPRVGERAGWARIDAVLALHRAMRLPAGRRVENIVGLGTAEIRRLARLPRWVLRGVSIPRVADRPSRIDWAALRASIAAYRCLIPVRDLLDGRVPYTLWGVWESAAMAAARPVDQWWTSADAMAAEEDLRRLRTLAAEVAEVHRQHLPIPESGREWSLLGGGLRWCGSADPLVPALTLHPHLQAQGGVLAVDAEGEETLEVAPDGTLHAVVRGPSGGPLREYRLRVPHWVRSVQAGVAWTYGLQPEEYAPAIRV